MKIPLVSIIILEWNGKEFLEKCLHSIIKYTTYPNYELIVVDNRSNDGSVNFVEKNFPTIKLVKNNENLGFSKGNNIGVSNSVGEYILILNNDTEIFDKGWLHKAVEIFESDKKIGVVGCKLIWPDGKFQCAGGHVNFLKYAIFEEILFEKDLNGCKYNTKQEVDYIAGAAIFIRGKVIKEVEGFDEIFSPCHYEDKDICIKVKRRGYKIIYMPKIEIIHYGSVTTKQHFKSEYVNYLLTRNKLLFALLNTPLKYLPVRIAEEFLSFLVYGIKKHDKNYIRAVLWNIKNLNLIAKRRIERRQKLNALISLP
ncbi:hypothetical protein MSIBF_A90005 [groundwater metagenome]|uniref:Glycosyltransferase 2-like domain-containing protein n=1 Tax=groundwater metagenome TaxID=717931 RepID=A0A098EER9_9ZZZZ